LHEENGLVIKTYLIQEREKEREREGRREIEREQWKKLQFKTKDVQEEYSV